MPNSLVYRRWRIGSGNLGWRSGGAGMVMDQAPQIGFRAANVHVRGHKEVCVDLLKTNNQPHIADDLRFLFMTQDVGPVAIAQDPLPRAEDRVTAIKGVPSGMNAENRHIIRPYLLHRGEVTFAKRCVKRFIREDQRIMICHPPNVIYATDSFKLKPPLRNAARVSR